MKCDKQYMRLYAVTDRAWVGKQTLYEQVEAALKGGVKMCIRDRLQMIKRIVPPMSNEIITLVKDTSLARIIALQEIIWAGQAFMKGSHGISGAIWPLFFTALYYLIWNRLLTVLFAKLEKKLDYFR